MVVIFKKLFCERCQKPRSHEVVVTPCCVVCNEYNFTYAAPEPTIEDSGTNEPLEIERFGS